VIGLWYLIFDAAGGQPLASGALAATIVGGAASVFAIFLRFVLHFGIFVVIGVIGAMMFATAESNDALFPTMIVLVPVFEIFSIMLLMLIGPSRSVSLPWWKFIIGDVMATFAMLAYFLERHPILAHHLEGAWTGVAREGAVAGVIGGIVVAIWFLICDSIASEVLRTPAVLGAAIFQGIFDPGRVQITLPVVLGYTVLHFFAFILFGIATAVLLYAAEYEPVFALGVIFLLAIFEVSFVCALAAFDEAALAAIGFWRSLVSNVLAIVAMLAYFETQHRGWLPRFRERWDVLQLRRSQNSRRPRLRAN
jgi:hypothetical protein